MTPEFTITTFGLRDAKGRRMREASLAEVSAGNVSVVFIATGEPGPNPFRFKIHGPRGVHAGPIQKAHPYAGAEPPTIMIEYALSPTAVAVAGKYRLSLCQMESTQENSESDRELHSAIFHVR